MQPFHFGITLRSVNASRMISELQFEPAPGLKLSVDEVQLWRVDLERVAPGEGRWRSVLSPDEVARANRFHFARDRQNFTATRALLRILLGAYLDWNPKAIPFRYGEREKPLLDAPLAGQVEFNVSHSGAGALIAFARARGVGVDIEQVRNGVDHETLAQRYFSRAEQKQLAALPPEERCRGFFRCWTRKEAYIKAHGAGLSLPLSAFDVSLAPGEKNALLATRPDGGEAALWSLREVEVPEGYEAALCVQGSGWVLHD